MFQKQFTVLKRAVKILDSGKESPYLNVPNPRFQDRSKQNEKLSFLWKENFKYVFQESRKISNWLKSHPDFSPKKEFWQGLNVPCPSQLHMNHQTVVILLKNNK